MALIPVSLAFIEGLGGPEMMLVVVIVLVLFGGQKLPELARGLGKTMREFKKAAAGVEDEFKRALEEDERKKTSIVPAAATPALLAPTSSETANFAITTTEAPIQSALPEPTPYDSGELPVPPLIPGPFAATNYDEYGEAPAAAAPVPTVSIEVIPPAPVAPSIPPVAITPPLPENEKRPDQLS